METAYVVSEHVHVRASVHDQLSDLVAAAAVQHHASAVEAHEVDEPLHARVLAWGRMNSVG